MTTWLKQRRKAIAAALAGVVTVANLWFPDYSEDAKKIVATVVLALGVLGVHHVTNQAKRKR